ncbi:hypothetical protein [Marinitenerispora sediminis]|uniref:hypothetical protein n=1 Tax=Marinitenerispora sediminis TaxID=1931232 RepID=UPI0015F12709|nr:hypothetical protein [Marinitenerispora sediminis]
MAEKKDSTNQTKDAKGNVVQAGEIKADNTKVGINFGNVIDRVDGPAHFGSGSQIFNNR